MPHTSIHCSVKMRHRCFNTVHGSGSQQQQHAEITCGMSRSYRHQGSPKQILIHWSEQGWEAKHWYFLSSPDDSREKPRIRTTASLQHSSQILLVYFHPDVPIWLLARSPAFLRCKPHRMPLAMYLAFLLDC